MKADARPESGAWVVVLKERRYALAPDLLTRASTLTVDSIRHGGLILIGLHEAEVDLFSPAGFTETWSRGFRSLLDLLMEQHRARIEAAHEARATRFFSSERPLIDEARELLRELAQLAQAGGIRWSLDFVAADLQSLSGVRDALMEAAGKVRVQSVRDTLVQRGFDEARIRRIPKLCDDLLHEQTEELVALGRQTGAASELLVWKAMALGDLTMLSNTARARLQQERWEPYQIGRLLGLSRPAGRSDDRPATPTAPTPAPVATPPANRSRTRRR